MRILEMHGLSVRFCLPFSVHHRSTGSWFESHVSIVSLASGAALWRHPSSPAIGASAAHTAFLVVPWSSDLRDLRGTLPQLGARKQGPKTRIEGPGRNATSTGVLCCC